MWWLLLAWFTQAPAPQATWLQVDVSRLAASAAKVVTEVDTGKLKGEPRQLAWSPAGDLLYLQTAEGEPPQFTLHHYTIAVSGGVVTRVDTPPEWAVAYWTYKQDRAAPGIPALVLDVQQGEEVIREGAGGTGLLDRNGSFSADNAAKGTTGDVKGRVVRLRLAGEEVGVWINEWFNAGAKFGWGPAGSGAIVHLDKDGRLVLFDRSRRRQVIAGVKDASLPAWSTDGSRLAFLQKTGRRKFAVTWLDLTLR